jgi:hypothetical protein
MCQSLLSTHFGAGLGPLTLHLCAAQTPGTVQNQWGQGAPANASVLLGGPQSVPTCSLVQLTFEVWTYERTASIYAEEAQVGQNC